MTVTRFARRQLRGALAGAALPVSSAVALVTVPRRPAGARPGRWAASGHAAVGLALGVVAVIPLAAVALFVARGVLYGIVVAGPYDTSWGGPTRTGAWIAHFLVGLGLAVLSLFALSGLAGLYTRWGRLLAGERGQRWVVPVTALVVVTTGLLVWAWTRQL
jgi:hypothetical protein